MKKNKKAASLVSKQSGRPRRRTLDMDVMGTFKSLSFQKIQFIFRFVTTFRVNINHVIFIFTQIKIINLFKLN